MESARAIISKLVVVIGILVIVTSCSNEGQQVNPDHQKWNGYGGSADQSKFVVQDQITLENVNQLEMVWNYPTEDGRSYQQNPMIVDDIMYVVAKDNSLVALNARNGEEIWIHTGLGGITRRGLLYWENEDRSDRRVIFTLRNTLQQINALTGESILSFGNNGIVDLRHGLGRDPNKIRRIASGTPGRIYGDLVILGSSPGESYLSTPGHVRAYNVLSGEMEWIFHTIPLPGEYGYDTWPEEAYKYVGGVNCWGEMTVDKENGIVFVPLGSPTYDYYGADRLGANLFADCLMALDASTGERIWHFQTVHHDLWDYDLTAAPQLITVNHDGKKIEAVALATKQGFMFAFNRLTGDPLWPVEERPVPPSNVPGEEAWPTQPFPTVLKPFTRQTVTVDDINPTFLSDQEYEDWKVRIAKAGKGLYTPIDTSETIAMPGAVGGANWGNTAANPEKGLVYVLSQDYPSFYQLKSKPAPFPAALQARIEAGQAIVKGNIAYNTYCQACHGKDLAGTALGPSILGLGEQLNISFLKETVLYGTGRMPGIQHISDQEISDILAFLKDKSRNSSASGETEVAEEDKIDGPVVANGGAPGEEETRSLVAFNMAGGDYPDEVKAPPQRYFTGYGLGRAFVMTAPWSSITAYDMNSGQIKWTRPLGEDPHAAAKGVKNAGVPTGTQRQGMIVTSNGILFSTVTNGKIYAYNAENGDLLWTGETPLGIATMPSMYEIEGRVYLAVNATTPQIMGWNLSDEEEAKLNAEASKEGGYYVFALPEL